MIEVKHTLGPWETLPPEEDKPYIRVRGTQLGCRYKIANVHAEKHESTPVLMRREDEETEANSRLIAAAPELLAALIGCVEHMEHSTPQGKAAWEAAHAAIRKATGKQRHLHHTEQAMKNVTILINQNIKGHWEWELRATGHLNSGPLDYSREPLWSLGDAAEEAHARAEWRSARIEAECNDGPEAAEAFPAFEEWALQRKR